MSDDPHRSGRQTEIWPGSTAADSVPTPDEESAPPPALRFKPIDRTQMVWAAMDVDQLLPADHLARAIWAMTERLDWRPFQAKFKAVEGQAGCTPYDPQLLACLWILAYSEGISSAPEIERRCEYHPAYRWLAALKVIGAKTLSNFRVAHKAALNRLFVQVLAALQSEGMIPGEQIMQDGTKVRAAASPGSLHREQSLRRHLEAAQQRVEQLSQASDAEPLSPRRQAAQQRGAQQRLQTLQRSLEELQQLQQAAPAAGADPAECRVSETEPEARKMKQPIVGGYAPSYNLQLMTDAAHDVVLNVAVVQAGNDQGQLEPGLDRLQQETGIRPKQAVVDEGYLSWETVQHMADRGIDLISGGPALEDKNAQLNQQKLEKRGVTAEYFSEGFVYEPEQNLYRCPAGQGLRFRGQRQERAGVQRHQYRARAAVCRSCPQRAQCCPGSGKNGRTITRTEYQPAIQAHVDKMKTPAAQAIYKLRKRVAEFPNLWLKEKLGLRRFCVRGLDKVTCESLWACLTYNIQQWWRDRWKPQLPLAAAA